MIVIFTYKIYYYNLNTHTHAMATTVPSSHQVYGFGGASWGADYFVFSRRFVRILEVYFSQYKFRSSENLTRSYYTPDEFPELLNQLRELRQEVEVKEFPDESDVTKDGLLTVVDKIITDLSGRM